MHGCRRLLIILSLSSFSSLDIVKEGMVIGKTVCLVKKNPTMPPSHENWIMMSGEQFIDFLKTPEGNQRKAFFVRLPAEEEDETTIIIECDQATAKEWTKELNRHKYLKRVLVEDGYVCVSLFDHVSNDNEALTWEETLDNPDQASVEDTTILNIERESLRKAISHLTQREYSIIYLLYLREPPLSIEDCARALGIARTTVYSFREKSIRKLRTLME